MGMITKLEAVNQMLLVSGENLVTDLLESSGVDTSIAEVILEQCSLDVQIRGMANNMIVRKYFADPTTKYLILPSIDGDEEGLISAELVSSHYSVDGSLVSTRIYNNRLWNITDDTDQWAVNTEYFIQIVSKLKWENLDTPVQRAILSSAMRKYQIITQGDEASDAYLANQEAIFTTKGKAADMNDKKRNIFMAGDAYYRSRNPYMYDSSMFRYWRTSY